MFTGIVLGVVPIIGLTDSENFRSILIQIENTFAKELALGASVSINGTCLTVVSFKPHDNESTVVKFDIIHESLKKTNLKSLKLNDRVNFERSLKVGDELGGHHVSGHVETVGVIQQRIETENNVELWVSFPARFVPYILEKGWIAIDGVSLTVVEVKDTAENGSAFSVCLIPETLRRTTLGFKGVGEEVNLEFDGQLKAIVNTVQRLLPSLVQPYLHNATHSKPQ
eukprot:TRINITY_DN391_c0_g1_i6.p1 TRINITY_DN391_c0_g1~~TRINITY_DN391_c0_g1_i6.p1  ORF type:complete len:226 (-),score=35.74 TRINITY_DN391_c0_g1_i6:118-795(-)